MAKEADGKRRGRFPSDIDTEQKSQDVLAVGGGG